MQYVLDTDQMKRRYSQLYVVGRGLPEQNVIHNCAVSGGQSTGRFLTFSVFYKVQNYFNPVQIYPMFIPVTYSWLGSRCMCAQTPHSQYLGTNYL